jgi:hypothetical protein
MCNFIVLLFLLLPLVCDFSDVALCAADRFSRE